MVVVNEEIVRNVVLPEFLSELYGALEVAIVAATDDAVDDARTLLAYVCILAASDASS